MERTPDSLSVVLVCVILVLATASVYWQVRGHEFVSLDDLKYVGQNEQVQNGLTWKGFIWAFTTRLTSNWHPLTWLSLMLDCQFSEAKAKACHTTNVLFHLVNTLLLLMVLMRMTGALWPSTFVAALFALHPLHVESVAWVSERKDVLSTFFWLMTMWAYVRYTKHPGYARYVPIVVFFVLGLMAKPMLVTLPFVLLLLDYWPLRRLQLRRLNDQPISSNEMKAENNKTITVCLLVEKLPLFALTVVSCVVTYLVQQSGGAVQSAERIGLTIRITNALTSYLGYIVKMVYPTGLAVFYPHTGTFRIDAAIVLVLISVLVVRWAPGRPYLPVGWLWYVGTLVPVIGLVQIGGQAMADRYTYVPLIGLFIMISCGAADCMKGKSYRKIILTTAAGVILLPLTICTWRQVSYWRDSITLYERALAVTTNNYLAHTALGLILAENGKTDRAIEHFEEALRIIPDDFMTHRCIALALVQKGMFDKAIKHYREVLRIKPDNKQANRELQELLAKPK